MTKNEKLNLLNHYAVVYQANKDGYRTDDELYGVKSTLLLLLDIADIVAVENKHDLGSMYSQYSQIQEASKKAGINIDSIRWEKAIEYIKEEIVYTNEFESKNIIIKCEQFETEYKQKVLIGQQLKNRVNQIIGA